jgi:transposase
VIYTATSRTVHSVFSVKIINIYQINNAKIEAAATNFSSAFIASVHTHASQTSLVFDHFHIVKLMNDTIDKIRRTLYHQEKDLNKRKVLKGTRWLLLCNRRNILTANTKQGMIMYSN